MIDVKKLQAEKADKAKLIRQKIAKLNADLAREQAKQKQAARRDDTRRKIVLGGALLAAAEKGKLRWNFVDSLVQEFVAERDRGLFSSVETKESAASDEQPALATEA